MTSHWSIVDELFIQRDGQPTDKNTPKRLSRGSQTDTPCQTTSHPLQIVEAAQRRNPEKSES